MNLGSTIAAILPTASNSILDRQIMLYPILVKHFSTCWARYIHGPVSIPHPVGPLQYNIVQDGVDERPRFGKLFPKASSYSTMIVVLSYFVLRLHVFERCSQDVQ